MKDTIRYGELTVERVASWRWYSVINAPLQQEPLGKTIHTLPPWPLKQIDPIALQGRTQEERLASEFAR